MKIAIIGAGISGLSVGKLLKEKHSVAIFEADNRPGGMIKCDRVNGHLFHRTGGHVFNTRNQEVLDFFWSHFNKEEEFVKADRNSGVSMGDGLFVPYPIENHIACFDDKTVERIINDWLHISSDKESKEYDNFADFLKGRFGQTLYDLYFRPYNEKVWRRDLTNVPLSWLAGKLPMPTQAEMIFNNVKKIEEKKFVHSTFFYAKQGGSQFVADRMAEGLHIVYGTNISTLSQHDGKWDVAGETFDKVVFCGNIKQLPTMLSELDGKSTDLIEKLESHGTTTVLCEIDDNPYSWIYMPSRDHESHRIICTGNFSPTNRTKESMSATIEFTDYISKEEILKNLEKMPWHPKYITHNYEKYTYPIQAPSTRETVKQLRTQLEAKGLYLCGRFAEWEYYNTDVCMASAIELSKRI